MDRSGNKVWNINNMPLQDCSCLPPGPAASSGRGTPSWCPGCTSSAPAQCVTSRMTHLAPQSAWLHGTAAQHAQMPPWRPHAETEARPTHQQVVIQRVLCPVHGLLLVGLRVREALHRACRLPSRMSGPDRLAECGLACCTSQIYQNANPLYALRSDVWHAVYSTLEGTLTRVPCSCLT